MTTKEFRASVGSVLTSIDKLHFILSHGSLEMVKTAHKGVEYECYLFTAKDQKLKVWVPVKEYLDPLERLFDTVYNDYKYIESKNKSI